MEMFFLILHYYNSAVVMPEKYVKDQCEAVGKATNRNYSCIPAPTNANKNYIDNMPKCSVNPTTGKLECN